MNNLKQALDIIEQLVNKNDITHLIRGIEEQIANKDCQKISTLISDNKEYNPKTLEAALKLKQVTGQLNIIIHAWGMLISLPYILESGEKIINTSLGAGNTGKDFDLETDRQIAEFKFIQWRGGPEAMRKKGLFKDFFYLAEKDTNKKKNLYLLGTDIPLTFFKSNTSIDSLVSRNNTLKKTFYNKYHNQFKVVSEYYNKHKKSIKIINLKNKVPEFK